MNYRNAKYISDDRIDCEIHHPIHGWIPYTIDPTDTDTTVDNAALLTAIGTNATPYVPPTQAELNAKAVLLDTQRIARIKEEFDNQDSVNKVLLKIGFLQENRLRVLEGKPEITVGQFRTWVENQID